jgi:hypothetical protein
LAEHTSCARFGRRMKCQEGELRASLCACTGMQIVLRCSGVKRAKIVLRGQVLPLAQPRAHMHAETRPCGPLHGWFKRGRVVLTPSDQRCSAFCTHQSACAPWVYRDPRAVNRGLQCSPKSKSSSQARDALEGHKLGCYRLVSGQGDHALERTLPPPPSPM